MYSMINPNNIISHQYREGMNGQSPLYPTIHSNVPTTHNNNNAVAPFRLDSFPYNHQYVKQGQHEQVQPQGYQHVPRQPLPIRQPQQQIIGRQQQSQRQQIGRQRQQQPQRPAAAVPIKRLKFLVLGAAGAGKTSILRRYFQNQFDFNRLPTLGSDFYTAQIPYPTNDSKESNNDNQSKTNQQPNNGKYNQQQQQQEGNLQEPASTIQVRIQMWDTPGRERYRMNQGQQQQRKQQQPMAASLSESFFDQADAILLVYDMTSSTSFKQLLKWYADIIELYTRKQQQRNAYNDNTGSNVTIRHPPILVCANKLDIFEDRYNVGSGTDSASKSEVSTSQQPQLNGQQQRQQPKAIDIQPQNPKQQQQQQPQGGNKNNRRDVFGFQRNFKGHDFHYEYQVCPITPITSSSLDLNRTTKENRKQQSEYENNAFGGLFQYLGKGDSIIKSRSNNNNNIRNQFFPTISGPDLYHSNNGTPSRRMEISAYLANRDDNNWINDGSYLESLLLSEDASHPDREMVVLWCRRNQLHHYDVSAATGYGISDVINHLVQLAISQQQEQEKQQQEAASSRLMDMERSHSKSEEYPNTSQVVPTTVDPSPIIQQRRRNDSLDLHQRYSKKDDSECCFLCNPKRLFGQRVSY